MFEKYKCIKSLIVLHSAEFVNDSSIKMALIKGVRKISKTELDMFNLAGCESSGDSEFGLRAAKEIVEYLFGL